MVMLAGAEGIGQGHSVLELSQAAWAGAGRPSYAPPPPESGFQGRNVADGAIRQATDGWNGRNRLPHAPPLRTSRPNPAKYTQLPG